LQESFYKRIQKTENRLNLSLVSFLRKLGIICRRNRRMLIMLSKKANSKKHTIKKINRAENKKWKWKDNKKKALKNECFFVFFAVAKNGSFLILIYGYELKSCTKSYKR